MHLVFVLIGRVLVGMADAQTSWARHNRFKVARVFACDHMAYGIRILTVPSARKRHMKALTQL